MCIRDRYIDVSTNSSAPDSVANIIARHTWTSQPSFEDADTVDATEIDPSIVTDGSADVRAKLQAVIDAYPKVFLPRGSYRLDNTLVLREDTQLFGIGKHFSRLEVGTGWNDTPGKPLVQTVNNANATTLLAHVFLFNKAPVSYTHLTLPTKA